MTQNSTHKNVHRHVERQRNISSSQANNMRTCQPTITESQAPIITKPQHHNFKTPWFPTTTKNPHQHHTTCMIPCPFPFSAQFKWGGGRICCKRGSSRLQFVRLCVALLTEDSRCSNMCCGAIQSSFRLSSSSEYSYLSKIRYEITF